MTMGRDRLVDRTIRPLTSITQITPAGVISNASSAGVIPIGNYKGVPAFWDLDKAVNQPLVWAEKQFPIDKVDERDGPAGVPAIVTVPVGAALDVHVPGVAPTGVITVPAGQVWYLQSFRFWIAQVAAAAAATNLYMSFRVSPFPQVAGVGKEYHAGPAFLIATPMSTVAAIAAGNVNIGPVNFTTTAGEMGINLRLVAGDTLIPVAWPNGGAALAGAPIVVQFMVYGYKAKVLVA